MKENILITISQKISVSLSNEQIYDKVSSALEELPAIYSYLVYAKYKSEALQGWLIQYNISQNDKYNMLESSLIPGKILTEIVNHKHKNCKKSVITYEQPSIELMLNLYKPLVDKLAYEQSEKWLELEFEDAVSMCQLTMVNLYRKGYYINKWLLKRSFENYVLMELRHSRNKPEVHSLEQIVFNDGDSGAITLGDMLPDTAAELAKEQAEENEAILEIFEEVKSIIIELIGERQFEQLLRDYGKKHTTSWSRKKMQQIKNKFNQLGITWSYLRSRV